MARMVVDVTYPCAMVAKNQRELVPMVERLEMDGQEVRKPVRGHSSSHGFTLAQNGNAAPHHTVGVWATVERPHVGFDPRGSPMVRRDRVSCGSPGQLLLGASRW
jgi:hypothetical protein